MTTKKKPRLFSGDPEELALFKAKHHNNQAKPTKPAKTAPQATLLEKAISNRKERLSKTKPKTNTITAAEYSPVMTMSRKAFSQMTPSAKSKFSINGGKISK